MKNARNLLCILVALMLVAGIVAGCAPATPTPTPTTAATPTPDVIDPNHPTYVTKDKVTMSIFMLWFSNFAKTYADTAGAAKMEELTNVHIDYTCVAYQEFFEKHQLLISSGQLTDMVNNGDDVYPGGYTKGVADGVFIDMTDYVAKYMPHYKALLASDPQVRKDATADDGTFPAIFMLRSNLMTLAPEPAWAGLMVRKDWLDDLGLAVPATIADWENVLTQFKEKKGADAPLLIGKQADLSDDSFLTAYGVLSEFYNAAGTVKYGPIEPGYKQWVQLFHDWYAKGLINPNFISSQLDHVQGDFTYLGTGRSGACTGIWGFSADAIKNMGIAQDAKFFMQGVQNPVLNAGDKPQAVHSGATIVNQGITVAKSCKTPEVAARWLDFQYTEQAMLINCYGIEGEDYTLGADGKPAFTDKIMKNAEHPNPGDMIGLVSRGDGAGIVDWFRQTLTASPTQLEAKATWQKDATDLMLPAKMTFSADEATQFAAKYTDIQTYVKEMTVKFILGEEPMANYDAFVQAVKDMGIQSCIDMKQTALGRYDAR